MRQIESVAHEWMDLEREVCNWNKGGRGKSLGRDHFARRKLDVGEAD